MGAGQSMVGVDAVGGNAELFEGGFLGGEVLLIGGAAGVADQGCRHGEKCNAYGPLTDRVIVPAM